MSDIYVNADKLSSFLDKIQSKYGDKNWDNDLNNALNDIKDYIEQNSVSGLQKAKYSEWEEIKFGEGVFDYQFKCKKCGTKHPKGYVVAPDYCAICGAVMTGKKQESEE